LSFRIRPRRSLGNPEGRLQEAIVTKQADFKRRVRARTAKTGESYTAARQRLLDARTPGNEQLRRALHVTNGDSAASTLRETSVAERVLSWRDALHEGPVPDVPDDELRRLRARLLADNVPEDATAIAQSLEERDRVLAAAARGEYVLWFEADLYDQLQLIQILARLRQLEMPPARMTLICIGEHLGIAHFGGLGELSAAQLEDLLPTAAAPLSDAALKLAAVAWSAFRADRPDRLHEIVRTRSPELRFLAEAFDRLSREYPSTRDGLSLTQRRVLAAVAAGAESAGAAFVRSAERETRPFLGDVFCFALVERLAKARAPLVEAEEARVTRTTGVRVTAAGARVLAGETDHVELNGIDRWIGGVHLIGNDAQWRWDEGTESVVEVQR
jgi:Domain of unknown function (DUF1835)